MFTLSGFADEIGQKLGLQLETLKKLNIRHLELRGVWGKNVLTLEDDDVERLSSLLKATGIGVSAIGSPIGKISINDDFTPHLDRLRRVVDIARAFETPCIRIFSYHIPKGEDPASYRDEVMRRMEAKVRVAEDAGITLLHENEKRIYGDQPERCLDIFETVKSPNLKAVFDPANFVQCGRRPYEECWPQLKKHVAYFHIKDAVLDTGSIVPAGDGDGDVAEILREAKDAGFDGFLSLEPHLKAAGPLDGFSGPELFEKATSALRKILKDIKADES